MNTLRAILFAILFSFLLPPSFLAAETANEEWRLEQLSWMSGDWRIDDGDRFIQEAWLEPVHGFMNATFRLFVKERLVVHEYILVSEEDSGIFLRFKHFNADYSTWEKDGPLVFRLVELRAGFARFENVAPAPEAPDVLEYLRSGDTLTATVSDTPGPQAGEAMVFRFQRHRDDSFH